ncbi:hypothetical protein FHR99_003195 [Litorivivens lipolytica]|uniref:Uncharacterized protein n=1 Tax=Litorivivens lipolytica TaxID=1524264 RepID=A0A7W4W7J1_9GAMM|nr:hypothetical protein [Litorivivens lipolytica]MBB3048921.1 hypothetical protein [Litorivivens lipolytica]
MGDNTAKQRSPRIASGRNIPRTSVDEIASNVAGKAHKELLSQMADIGDLRGDTSLRLQMETQEHVRLRKQQCAAALLTVLRQEGYKDPSVISASTSWSADTSRRFLRASDADVLEIAKIAFSYLVLNIPESIVLSVLDDTERDLAEELRLALNGLPGYIQAFEFNN